MHPISDFSLSQKTRRGKLETQLTDYAGTFMVMRNYTMGGESACQDAKDVRRRKPPEPFAIVRQHYLDSFLFSKVIFLSFASFWGRLSHLFSSLGERMYSFTSCV